MAAYYDATENALKHAWGAWDAISRGWNWDEDTIDAEGNTGQHTNLAVADDGTLHISYYSPAIGGNLIISSQRSKEHGGGVGVFAWRLDEDQPFELVLRRNLVEEQPGSAAYLRDSKVGMMLLIDGNLFRNNGTPPLPGGVFLQGSVDGI